MKTLGTFRENPWHFLQKTLALLLGTLGTFRYTLAGKGLEDIGNHVYMYGDEAHPQLLSAEGLGVGSVKPRSVIRPI